MNTLPPYVFASKLNRQKCEELWDPSIPGFKVPLMFNALFDRFMPQNGAYIKFEGSYLGPLFSFIAEHQDPQKTFDFPRESKFYYYLTRVQFDKRTKPPPHSNMVGLLRAYPTMSRNRIVFRDAVFYHGRDCAQYLVTKNEPLTTTQANAMVSRLGIDLTREGFAKMLEKNREQAQRIHTKSSSPPSCSS